MGNIGRAYQCWLGSDGVQNHSVHEAYGKWFQEIVLTFDSPLMRIAGQELADGIEELMGFRPRMSLKPIRNNCITLCRIGDDALGSECNEKELGQVEAEGFMIESQDKGDLQGIRIVGRTDRGLLYGVFCLLRLLKLREDLTDLYLVDNPTNPLRMLNHWDNLDGGVERGYAGRSILYEQNRLTDNLGRVRDYARLLASIGINGVVINNVNVHQEETRLITSRLHMVETLAKILRDYGIKVFLSINFASPLSLNDLDTADPCDPQVVEWWQTKVANIYSKIPDFGGFLVKADSENRPGPFTYGRSHAEGANMLASALQPFGGLLIWRCFVYDCQQDWRDYETDRARAAYDNFMPLDGEFHDNVILQIKNGPMDFQVREPVSPVIGGLQATNQMMELQITQEYTGQQRHLCYLVPQWKEILDFDTYARGQGSYVKRIIDGSIFGQENVGITAVVNVGRDPNWTGHTLAQANLYGYGRLAWNPDLSAEEITDEWVRLTFGHDPMVIETVSKMLLASWQTYENYTSPLGIGWMINPGYHYGPNVDGYEYSRWGTYHRADYQALGVDRSVKSGTGFAGQYYPENALLFETPKSCPEELVLFFHRLPYTYELKSGKTLIQHIYDSHFAGVEEAKGFLKMWESIEAKIDAERYNDVRERLKEQIEHAKEWRDVVNTYFYRKSGIPDRLGRKIY